MNIYTKIKTNELLPGNNCAHAASAGDTGGLCQQRWSFPVLHHLLPHLCQSELSSRPGHDSLATAWKNTTLPPPSYQHDKLAPRYFPGFPRYAAIQASSFLLSLFLPLYILGLSSSTEVFTRSYGKFSQLLPHANNFLLSWLLSKTDVKKVPELPAEMHYEEHHSNQGRKNI